MILDKTTLYGIAGITALYYGKNKFLPSEKKNNITEKDNLKDLNMNAHNNIEKESRNGYHHYSNNSYNQYNYYDHKHGHNKINIDYVKDLIGESIHSKDIKGLEEGIKLLNEIIDGYELLVEKFNQKKIMDLNHNLNKLLICKAKSLLELGYLYDNNNDFDAANRSYLLAIKYANMDTKTGKLIIKKSLTKLVNNEFIF